MIDQALAELEPLTSVTIACGLLGKPRATLYRHRNPAPKPERQPAFRPAHPAALSPGWLAIQSSRSSVDVYMRALSRSPVSGSWQMNTSPRKSLASIAGRPGSLAKALSSNASTPLAE